MSDSLRKTIPMLPPSFFIKAGFRVKRSAVKSVQHDLFSPVWDSYEKAFDSLLNDICKDIGKIRAANADMFPDQRFKPRKIQEEEEIYSPPSTPLQQASTPKKPKTKVKKRREHVDLSDTE